MKSLVELVPVLNQMYGQKVCSTQELAAQFMNRLPDEADAIDQAFSMLNHDIQDELIRRAKLDDFHYFSEFPGEARGHWTSDNPQPKPVPKYLGIEVQGSNPTIIRKIYEVGGERTYFEIVPSNPLRREIEILRKYVSKRT